MATRSILPLLMLGLLLPGVALAQPPDEDQVLQDLLAKFETERNDSSMAHLKMVSKRTVNDEEQPEDTQEIWVRDATHLRAERTDGTIVVYNGNDLKVFHGPSKVMLLIPPETFAAMGDERDAALGQIGVGSPTLLFDALIESAAGLALDGEEQVGGMDCWRVAVSPAVFDIWERLLQTPMMGQEITLRSLQMVLGKEFADFRGMSMEASVATEGGEGVDITIDQRMVEFETVDQVPDELLTFDEPEGTTIITWKAGQLAWDVMPEFQRAVVEAMQAQAP